MTEQERVLAGGGEMGALMRAKDWSQTPLGPVEGWPPALRTSISLMLASPYPICVHWGPGLVQLYNDHFRPLLGGKSPKALGQPVRVNFPETWDVLGPMFEGVLHTQTAVSFEDQLLPMKRKDFVEEAYFTYSFTPLRDEHGHLQGILNVASETTSQVLGARRFKLLRELSIRTASAQDVRSVLSAAEEVLAHTNQDVSFALLYRVEGDRARLALRAGLDVGASAAAGDFGLGDTAVPWPLAEVSRSGEELLLTDLRSRLGPLNAGPGPEPVDRALLLPLSPRT